MSQPDPARNPPDETPENAKGDPWHAFGYLVSGVFLYGALGWLGDRWLGTRFLVVVGILFGAVLGIYMTVQRFDAMPGWRIGRRGGEDEKK